jgi:hypothetical protein
MPRQLKPNDLSRSLIPLDMDTTLIAVVELSLSSWLVAGIVPGIERRWRIEAACNLLDIVDDVGDRHLHERVIVDRCRTAATTPVDGVNLVAGVRVDRGMFLPAPRCVTTTVHADQRRPLRRVFRRSGRRTTPAMMVAGSHTHKNSLQITSSPRALKNESPMGETLMGRNGKRYRVSSNGAKNATPRPPSVIASKAPCDAVTTKKYEHRRNLVHRCGRRGKARNATIKLKTSAKASECERPRCPSMSS